MIGEEKNPELVASWKAERRWFRWTVGFTIGLCLWVVGSLVLQYYFSKALSLHLGTRGSVGPTSIQSLQAALKPLAPFSIALTILMVVASLGFIISLAKWLLAIRRRRKMEFSAGFHPVENR